MGDESQAFIKQLWGKKRKKTNKKTTHTQEKKPKTRHLSYRAAEEQIEVCEAALVLGQHIHFPNRACTTGKKEHGLKSQHFPLHPPPSRPPLHPPTALNYYIPARLPQSPSCQAEPGFYCAWHILEWSHGGLRIVRSHFIPLRGNLLRRAQHRLSPRRGWGGVWGCSTVGRSSRVLTQPVADVDKANVMWIKGV